MKIIKRIFPLIVVLAVLFAFIPTETFADPISLIGMASALDAYGMSYGVGTTYDVANSQGISDSFEGLWDQFSKYQTTNNATLPTIDGVSYSYDQYIEEWQENYRAVKADELTHSSGKFASFYIDEESAFVFDQFWNWLLSGPAEMTRVDNAYQWEVNENTNVIDPISIYSPVLRINKLPEDISNASTIALAQYVGFGGNYNFYYASGSASVTDNVFIFRLYNTQNIVLVSDSNSNKYIRMWSNRTGDSNFGKGNAQSFIVYNTDYDLYSATVTESSISNGNFNQNLPIASDLGDAFSVVYSYLGGDNAGVAISPYGNKYVNVPLPNVTDPNYSPTAITIVTNVPWDDTYDDEDTDESTGLPVPYPTNSVPDVIDNIADKMVDDGFSIEDDPQPDDPDSPPPAPSEVFYPLLPVAAPSFNFNLSGIWHYVREWVSSLGSWFSLVFTIWSYLPYAIVVPVYATAVIVIVLGVYKRFFM